ncbi:MAG: sigma-70 family RNA polymerase sigma factor [Roseburia sp.]|nr:sigma-70 family RNA polymerase sigma factor [Roseburia sp.]
MNQRIFDELISYIADNNIDALEKFYQEYGEIIFGVAFSVCKSKSEADEVVNEVLIKVWNSANDLHGIEKPDAWIYRVTYNFAINKIKSRQKLDELEDNTINDESYEKVLDNLAFYEIIEELSEAEKDILIYKFIGDKTFEDIAEIMRKPKSTVAYKYYSALKKLRKRLKKYLL